MCREKHGGGMKQPMHNEKCSRCDQLGRRTIIRVRHMLRFGDEGRKIDNPGVNSSTLSREECIFIAADSVRPLNWERSAHRHLC